MSFGCLLIGPPGSGKSTCCKGLQHFFQLTGRPVAVVNLDPGNDALPYECSVDIADLVSQEEVAAQLHLGPNGGARAARACVGRPGVHRHAWPARAALCARASSGAQHGLEATRHAGLLYCMSYLAQNMDWLQERLAPLQQSEVIGWAPAGRAGPAQAAG